MPVIFFDEYRPDHDPIVGGKCSSLGAMTTAGLPVPDGFAVTTEGFLHSINHHGIYTHILERLEGLDHRDLEAVSAAGAEIRSAIVEAGPAPEVADAIRCAYTRLCERSGDQVRVAVRSSANAEDQPDASFAGQQDTYLWVGGDDVVAKVVDCWASLFTDRAIVYRAEHGYPHSQAAICVGVQKMVEPVAAGVAFTLNPTNGDRSKVVIDSAWGLGESVVSGSVTPDNFVVDKVIFEIVKKTISPKEIEVVPAADGVEHRPLDPERSTAPSLTDDQVRAVARMARAVEKHFGRPQDVEWALDPHTADGEPAVVLLQSRPETVWSNKPRPTVSQGVHSAMDGIVSTLLNPVRVKPET
ncbi:MAG: phosphoenolpyruvate synthase [Actinomyces sp.]|nr:MAG: phosphoenolpyruvate synthase [Actinomyces sp.]